MEDRKKELLKLISVSDQCDSILVDFIERAIKGNLYESDLLKKIEVRLGEMAGNKTDNAGIIIIILATLKLADIYARVDEKI